MTPSCNQATFLERTLQSVFNQKYPDLQFGVVDGGSTDGSVDILYRNAGRLDYLIIEPDDGQSEAINKGLRLADGDIVGWLNSDDTLLPGALHHVAKFFAANPDAEWLIGHCVEIDAEDRVVGHLVPTGTWTLCGALLREQPFNIPQPACFWRSSLMRRVGLLDEKLHHCMDFDLWCRFLAAGATPCVIPDALATYRLHDTSKTVAQPRGFHDALLDIEARYAAMLPLLDRMRLLKLMDYQRRLITLQRTTARPWRAVMRRPWWLLSSDIREVLWRGRVAA